MATTMFFEESITCAFKPDQIVDLEIGRSSFLSSLHGDLIYLKINGQAILLDEDTGKKLVEAVHDLGKYLNYSNV